MFSRLSAVLPRFVALALLASAGAADEALVDAWMQRMSLLSEIETAVRNERQLHQKEHIIREWHRKKNKVYQRDLLPGPGEYQLRDTWKSPSKGATKISDANPKSDVDWAIHFAKQLPGPGEVRDIICCLFRQTES